MRKRRITLFFFLLAVLWMLLVLALIAQPAVDSSRLSGGFTQLLLRLLPGLDIPADRLEPILRKVAHAFVFGVEGLLLGCAAGMALGGRRGAALSAGICALMAVGGELLQTLADGRSCELRDMAINFGGALLGVGAAMALLRLCRRKN